MSYERTFWNPIVWNIIRKIFHVVKTHNTNY
jgi:hypothetical protein